MTGTSGMTDFDRFVTSWLEDEGPQDVRAELVEAGIVGARDARQRRGLEGVVFGSGAWPRPRSVGRPVPFRRLAIVIAILLLAAAAAVFIGGLIRLPSPVEPPGRVDYLAYSIDGDIYLADPDGRDPIRIADGTQQSGFWSMSWSPDGRHMSLDGDGKVDVVDLTGRIVLSTPGCCSAWSPDGKLIAILVSFGGGGGPPDAQSGGAEFVIVDTAGTVRSSLPAGAGEPNFLGSGVDIHWTPDGRSITFTGVTFGGGDPAPGALIPVAGGPRTPLSVAPIARSTAYYSPDGTKVVGQTINGAFVVAAADGTEARPLVTAGNVPGISGWYGTLWSPDGTRIAASASSERGDFLYVIDVATGNPTKLSESLSVGDSSWPIDAISWDGQRDRILFRSKDGLSTIGSDSSNPQLVVEGGYEGAFQPMHRERP